MTSAITGKTSERKPSRALRNLKIVLGEERVSLNELRPEELQLLIKGLLDEYDLREMRGFTELREILQRSGDEPLKLDDNAILKTDGFSEKLPFTLKSHVIRLGMGALSFEGVYRRYESDEETTDREKAQEWGRSAYLYQGTEKILLMRRLPESCFGEEKLILTTYLYTKVPNKKLWLIGSVWAETVPINRFCKDFGSKASWIAHSIFGDLASMYQRTADELESKARKFRSEALKRERLFHGTFSTF